MNYNDFLSTKITLAPRAGFEPVPSTYHPSLKPHQRDAITWALRLGRALVAMSFGLGKSRIQCELARQIVAQSHGHFLVVCPLGVKHQFAEEDGPAMAMRWQYVRNDAEIQSADTPYLITNYERVRDGGITPALHNIAGVSLDEGSVLRSLGSVTSDVFKRIFRDVPFRFVCTATPSPNDFKELIYYAEFLGVMDHGQALTRFFKRDAAHAGHLTLMPSQEQEFWLWVASWALFVSKPSDLGYSDDGYVLPRLNIHWHRLPVDHTRAWAQTDDRGQRRLLLDASGGVSQASEEKRETLHLRIEAMLEIVLHYLCEQTSNIEGGNENAAGTQSGILSAAPGGIESPEAGVLSRCCQREDRPREKERVYARVPQNLQAQAENAGGNRRAKSQTPGTLCNGSGVQGKSKIPIEAEKSAQSTRQKEWSSESGIRNNHRTIQRHAGTAGRGVRYLWRANEKNWREGKAQSFDVRGSRPQDRKSARSSLQSMQFRFRPIQRRSDIAGESNRVSQQLVIWCSLNDEQREIERVLSRHGISVSSIYGSLSIDETEHRLYEWKNKKTSVLLSKASMLGSGVNLQQCGKVVYVGVDYKFQDFIQSIHRVYRFLQRNEVDAHVIFAESEDQIVDVLKRKWQQHDELVAKMQKIIRQYGLTAAAIQTALTRCMGVDRMEVKGQLYTAIHNDCVAEVKALPENLIDLWHTSIPFGNHYEYTTNFEDFGHNQTDEKFWQQMDFLIPELLRTLKPGRVAAIHVKDRQLYGHQTASGIMETAPFSDECVMAFRKAGFTYQGRRTIATDVVRENNQTYRLSYGEMLRDASKMSQGLPEYLLLFRKPPTSSDNARADEPVRKSTSAYSLGRWQVDAHAVWRSSGDRPLTPEEMAEAFPLPEQLAEVFRQEQLGGGYDYDRHVAICEALEKRNRLPKFFQLLPPRVTRRDEDMVWDDVVYMRTLNSAQSHARRENHICPLPFDIVERTIRLYSNEGDLVGDPFGGLGTVGVSAIKLGRRAWLCELNAEYFTASTQYLQAAELEVQAPTLFDLSTFALQEAASHD